MEQTTTETPDGLTLRVAHHRADQRPNSDDGVGAVEDSPNGTALLAHGITQDMDEGGMFVRLAGRLSEAGFDVVRFSFRGHGDSDGEPAGVTIAGERLDFQAAFEHTREQFPGPYFVVAKSFGAVTTCLSLDHFADAIEGVVLWNPVLDIEGTFLEPTVPWGREHFTGESLDELRERGTLSITDDFEMGEVLYEELARYDPGARLRESEIPALVIHGDADEIVPYEDARRVADAAGAEFHTIENADHAFLVSGDQPPTVGGYREQDKRTLDWLVVRSES